MPSTRSYKARKTARVYTPSRQPTHARHGPAGPTSPRCGFTHTHTHTAQAARPSVWTARTTRPQLPPPRACTPPALGPTHSTRGHRAPPPPHHSSAPMASSGRDTAAGAGWDVKCGQRLQPEPELPGRRREGCCRLWEAAQASAGTGASSALVPGPGATPAGGRAVRVPLAPAPEPRGSP